jgi:hypothetical protein
MSDPSEIKHIYDLTDQAFESVITAFYFRAWEDFESAADLEIELSNVEIKLTLNRFLASQYHRREKRHSWEGHDLTLMSIYRQALEDFQYRHGLNSGYVTVPIATQRASSEAFKEIIIRLTGQTFNYESRSK